jgi:hypothetical protein
MTDEDLRASPPDGLGLSKLQLARVRKDIKKACRFAFEELPEWSVEKVSDLLKSLGYHFNSTLDF